MKCLLGKKIGMTTIYDNEKGALNITLLSCDSNKVSQIRVREKDGYDAFQCEFSSKKGETFKKEFRQKKQENIPYKQGDSIKVDIFSLGEKVSVSGITKAKGFQGVVKRHGFSGAPKTHGHKHDLRAPGSIGSSFPEHVFKGIRMAGRMGGNRLTVNGLRVAFIDEEKSILGIRGAVPGKIGTIIEVVSLGK